jgi:8-oxo-dGTP diphosphatase
VRRGDEILLVQQGLGEEGLHWSLPGGILEDGELLPEGIAREVLEETGVEILTLGRLAYVLQVDSRQPPRFRRSSGSEIGYLVTVWTFEVEAWRGDLDPRDPDGVVHEAAFVRREDALARLGAVWWHALTVRYLRGEVEPGSLHLERWHPDGRVEIIGSVSA